MRKLSIPVVFLLGTSLLACEVQVGSSRRDPATPQNAPPAAAPAPQPAKPGVATFGKRAGMTPVTPGSPAPAPTPPPAGIPVLVGSNLFGSGTPDLAGWKGSFFSINAGTVKLPALASITPNGVLFAKELNVAAKPMTGGFPGIDASRNENFAIRWEAPLIVDNEADYTFRILSDDGAIVTIDGTVIVDNDGVHGPTEKSGPVHLVKGTHAIAVDYFQSTGGVALQLFCKKAGGTETLAPTRL